jgi:predicted protein tyrosine phosphatase
MAEIHICALKLVESLSAEIKPSHVLSLLGGLTPFPPTPAGVDPANHLKVTLADISAPEDGLITPASDHVMEIIAFGQRWAAESGGKRPILVHCFAGISRSTASALTIACALRPEARETDFARALRSVSGSAQPNSLMIEHADDLLARRGRLIDATASMGLADFSLAGVPFVLRLDQ